MPRLDPRQMYPAHDPEVAAWYVRTRSGVRVRVVEGGPRDGEPVVLLPGWGASAYLYRKNVPALARAGFRAIAVDLKGHGLSDKPDSPDEYTLSAMAEHAREVLDALELRSASIVGQSMSGAIASQLALEAPERVRRLVLIAPVGYGSIRALWFARLAPVGAGSLLARFSPRWIFQLVMRRVYGRMAQATDRDIDEYWSLSADPGLVRSLHYLVHRFGWRACEDGRLRALRVPVLLILGGRDEVISSEAADCYRRDIEGVRVLTVADAGHMVNEEAPDIVNRALIEFLRAERPAREDVESGATMA